MKSNTVPWSEERKAAVRDFVRGTGKGPCLVPLSGHGGVTSHERDFCQCDLQNAFDAGVMWAVARAAKHLEEMKLADPWSRRDAEIIRSLDAK